MPPFTLEEIVPTDHQIKGLFVLLKSRVHSISHKNLPTFEEHTAFVKKHPYRCWYLIKLSGKPIASVYVGEDNSIGLNNSENLDSEMLKGVLAWVFETFSPLDAIASLRSDVFFVNVSATDTRLMALLVDLGFEAIQCSYTKRK